MSLLQPQAHSTRRSGGAMRALLCHGLLLLALGQGGALLAQGQGGGAGQNPGEPRGEQQEETVRTRVSRREASDLAREAFAGRVLNIRLENRHWRVRMDQEGTVFNVLVDADTGDVTRSQD